MDVATHGHTPIPDHGNVSRPSRDTTQTYDDILDVEGLNEPKPHNGNAPDVQAPCCHGAHAVTRRTERLGSNPTPAQLPLLAETVQRQSCETTPKCHLNAAPTRAPQGPSRALTAAALVMLPPREQASTRTRPPRLGASPGTRFWRVPPQTQSAFGTSRLRFDRLPSPNRKRSEPPQLPGTNGDKPPSHHRAARTQHRCCHRRETKSSRTPPRLGNVP